MILPLLERSSPGLLQAGPVLTIRVEPVLAVQEAMQADGDAVPFASTTMLIDTGASGTLIQTAVVTSLGFASLGTVFLRTPTTTEPVPRDQYLVRLVFSEDIAFEVEVVEAPLVDQGIQGLIGRDILHLLKFVYDGPGNRFTISVP